MTLGPFPTSSLMGGVHTSSLKKALWFIRSQKGFFGIPILIQNEVLKKGAASYESKAELLWTPLQRKACFRSVQAVLHKRFVASRSGRSGISPDRYNRFLYGV